MSNNYKYNWDTHKYVYVGSAGGSTFKLAALPRDRQAGGEHYKNLAIQPIEYCQRNKLGAMESNVVKYVTRHGNKGKAKDIKKAIHMLEMLLKEEYDELYDFVENVD
jgi:hypothetical protein